MVSDGMSAGVPMLADAFSRMTRNTGTHYASLAKDPMTIHGLLDMASLSSLVTDSAAAVSSWSTGSRVANGSINILPDGRELKPIGRLARDTGRKVGLVTTATITHATPADFLACVSQRNMEKTIAAQYLNAGDVFFGGGACYFQPDESGSDRDLQADFVNACYKIIYSRDELNALTPTAGKVLGIFDRSHLPFRLDWNGSEQLQKRVPRLAEMTRKALELLGDGFLLQVEGGRVDHAAHSNDASGIVWEQLDFDDALGDALTFAKERDDTLVVVVTDHGNSNPGLNGTGVDYRDTTTCFSRLKGFTRTFDAMHADLNAIFNRKREVSSNNIIECILAGTGLELKKEEAQALAKTFEKNSNLKRPQRHDWSYQQSGFDGLLGQMLGNHTGIGWTGTSHTGDWVLAMATGPGADKFHGLLRNTDVFGILTGLMNSSYKNPSAGV
jgi:alkaline phosphatase